MTRWEKLARTAANAALRFRVDNQLGYEQPCDVYELITAKDLDLQFVDVPSLEGMFLCEPEVTRICVCARRPWGRQRFTAAHELGHYVMQHGTQVDLVIDSRGDDSLPDEEILADAFARYLLMPPRAVRAAFGKSDYYDPVSIYKASCWLGVGYSTLVHQMHSSLQMIDLALKDVLLKHSRQQIMRALVTDAQFRGDVWVLDESWNGRTLHVQRGDGVIGITNSSTAVCSPSNSNGTAIVTAVGRELALLSATTSVTLCASKREYVGFYDYRYLGEL